MSGRERAKQQDPVLRELRPEDAPCLLELVRGEAAAGRAQGDGNELSLADVQRFILSAQLTAGDAYRAVCDGSGAFLGLIGLKGISRERAEFCIALCEESRGQGRARQAAEELLTAAFCDPQGPERVYMYTRPDNADANGFNRALGFRPQSPEPDAPADAARFSWYGVSREEFLARRK